MSILTMAPPSLPGALFLGIRKLEIFPERLEIAPLRAFNQLERSAGPAHFDGITIVDFNLFLTVRSQKSFF